LHDGNIFGNSFKIVSFGESHGKCMGCVIDGCPAGVKISKQDIQKELDQRRPQNSIGSTKRAEPDQCEILSGVFNGYTTGAPICLIVWNKDVDSSYYESIKDTPRPGHADFTAFIKYGGFNDYRGGGRFSGRSTISIVLAGAIAKKILLTQLNIQILSYIKSVANISSKLPPPTDLSTIHRDPLTKCIDPSIIEDIKNAISDAQHQGDSLGGIIESIALNLPPGLGEPFFDTLEGDLSKILFAIPAVKAVEFGSGFMSSTLTGSKHNDPFIIKKGKILTSSNNSGGINGGISNGMPIIFRTTIKPTPSISISQKTVNIKTLQPTSIKIRGRHDTIIALRAVPVIESATAIVILDHAIRSHIIPPIIK